MLCVRWNWIVWNGHKICLPLNLVHSCGIRHPNDPIMKMCSIHVLRSWWSNISKQHKDVLTCHQLKKNVTSGILWILSLKYEITTSQSVSGYFSLSLSSSLLSLARHFLCAHEIKINILADDDAVYWSIARQIKIPNWTIKLTSEPLLPACHFGNVYKLYCVTHVEPSLIYTDQKVSCSHDRSQKLYTLKKWDRKKNTSTHYISIVVVSLICAYH